MGQEPTYDYTDYKEIIATGRLPEIGRGSFGKVYAHENRAIKIVFIGVEPGLANPNHEYDEVYDEHIRELLCLTEIKNGQKRNDPGSQYLIQIFDIAVDLYGEGYAISMALAQISLFQLITSSNWEGRAFDISPLFELEGALQFLHSLGWWHRDIKPGNILFCGRDDSTVYKLCDVGQARPFGTAFGINDSTPQCQTTYLYALPGLLLQSKRPNIGCDADYYALGASILHALFPEKFYLEEETEKNGLHFALHVVPPLLKQSESRLLPHEMDCLWKWISFQE